MLRQYKDGSLGCACAGTGGLGEYFDGAMNGLETILDTTPKKVGAGIALVGVLYLLGKKMKFIPNRFRSNKRKSRRSRRSR
jgi:hypothetical protein